MSEQAQRPDAERLENLLRTSSTFRTASTRRTFMGRLLAAGGGVALGGAVGAGLLTRVGIKTVHASANPVIDFGNAAVGAERIAVAFYDAALGNASPFGVAADAGHGTLLNSQHRDYFQAARNQEQSHLDVLRSLNLAFPYSTFAFPAGTFDSAKSMLAFGEGLESIFIGAYLGAIKLAAQAANDFIAEAAAQILGVECEHRALIRDIAGADPPNARFFQGNIGAPSGDLGNGDSRSTVYASAGDAVSALLALGIQPS